MHAWCNGIIITDTVHSLVAAVEGLYHIITLCLSTDGVVFHPSLPSSAGLFPAASLDTFPSVPDLPRLEGKHGTQHSPETKQEVKVSKRGREHLHCCSCTFWQV